MAVSRSHDRLVVVDGEDGVLKPPLEGRVVLELLEQLGVVGKEAPHDALQGLVVFDPGVLATGRPLMKRPRSRASWLSLRLYLSWRVTLKRLDRLSALALALPGDGVP